MLSILGLDPSLNAFGLAAYDPTVTGQTPHDSRYITAYTFKSDTRLDMNDPARWEQLIAQVRPYYARRDGVHVIAVVEKLFPTVKGNSHDALVSLRSALLHDMYLTGATFAHVQQATLKVFATGSGNASKKEVLNATRETYGHLLNVGNDNEADALQLLAMGMYRYLLPLASLPMTHTRALDTPEWPDLFTIRGIR